jgi:hypothetical protein
MNCTNNHKFNVYNAQKVAFGGFSFPIKNQAIGMNFIVMNNV